LSTTTVLSQRSTRNLRGSTIRSWHFLPSPHYARDAVARSWRWSCYRATTGARTRKVRDPRRPGFRLCKAGWRRRQGWSAAQSASGASTFLWPAKGSPGFPPNPRPRAGPLSPLSMVRSRRGVTSLQTCPPLAGETIPASGASRSRRSR
jgi:hypothetical protein